MDGMDTMDTMDGTDRVRATRHASGGTEAAPVIAGGGVELIET